MQVKQSIFRDYDIRGIAGVKFEPEMIAEYEKWYGPFPGITIDLPIAEAIGKAYGTYISRQGGKKVIVGYEWRPFADELKAAFLKGILSTGVNVDDAGKTATPFVYFMTAHKNYDGGVNITGSHNVYFYNGFKMMGKNTYPVYGDELQKLFKMIITEDFVKGETPGVVENISGTYEVYRDFVASKTKLKRKLKVAIDCGNGTPGLYVKDFMETLGADMVAGLYLEPDAYFPNHVPDPESPSNMADLQKAVIESGADIGIGFDADGDRAGFIDEKGNFLFADEILLLLARDIASRHQGKKILFDVKCTQLLEEMIPTWGCTPVMYRTGHAPIKAIMRDDSDIALCGEVSGHFYFVENYVRADDGLFAAAQVLRILSEQDKPMSELMNFIPRRIRTPEIKLPCKDEVKFEVIDKVKKQFEGKYDVITIDGARVMFTDKSWGLVRASNTSPYLTVRFEAETAEEVIKSKNIFADILDPIEEIGDKLDRKNVISKTGRLGYL